jgi:hypothetical protein
MKRRTFIKALGAAALAPFLPDWARSAEKAIPDPASSIVLGREPTHVHDALRYAISARGVSGDDKLDGQEECLRYYSGLQWSKAEQRELNRRRSRVVDRLVFNKIKR